MPSENDRDERAALPTDLDTAADAERDDEDQRDERGDAAVRPTEDEAPDPNTPRNRAERRAAAKAARRGRPSEVGEGASDPGAAAAGDVPRRPRVPPRTMSKGTGDVEGVPDWARGAGDLLARHRRTLGIGVVAVALAVGGTLGLQWYTGRSEAQASTAYTAALDVFQAPVQREGEPENTSGHPGPQFHSNGDRLRAATEKFRQVEQRYPRSRVAPLARLSEASALYQLGRYDEARQLYRGLLGADVAGLDGRVLEGLAFVLESTNDLDGAMQRYRELQTVAEGAYRDRAQFYQARLMARRNDATHAKDLLHGLIERTGHVPATDPTAASTTELRDQAIALLRDLDPRDPLVVARDRENIEGGGSGHGRLPQGLQGLPPELLQQLMRAQQTKQGGRH